MDEVLLFGHVGPRSFYLFIYLFIYLLFILMSQVKH